MNFKMLYSLRYMIKMHYDKKIEQTGNTKNRLIVGRRTVMVPGFPSHIG